MLLREGALRDSGSMRPFLLILGGILLLHLGLAWIHPNADPPYSYVRDHSLNVDGFWYLAEAKAWILGREPQVHESFRQPLVSYPTYLFYRLGGVNFVASRALNSLASMLTIALLAVDPASTHKEWIRERIQDYLPGNRTQLLAGSILPAQAYYKAQKLRSLLRQQVMDALSKYDVLVTPTVGRTAQDIESFAQGTLIRRPYLYTSTFNLANAPAISLPCGFSSDGLPIGLQIGGKPGDDSTVLKVAHAYEQNTQWHTMRPPNA